MHVLPQQAEGASSRASYASKVSRLVPSSTNGHLGQAFLVHRLFPSVMLGPWGIQP